MAAEIVTTETEVVERHTCAGMAASWNLTPEGIDRMWFGHGPAIAEIVKSSLSGWLAITDEETGSFIFFCPFCGKRLI